MGESSWAVALQARTSQGLLPKYTLDNGITKPYGLVIRLLVGRATSHAPVGLFFLMSERTFIKVISGVSG